MNDRIWFLAREAGFVFWENEDWKPANARIDWSGDYNLELQKFAECLINAAVFGVGVAEVTLSEEKEAELIVRTCGNMDIWK